MKAAFEKYIVLSALLLLLGQCANQIFCGDADCLQGGPAENCTTILCSLLGKHTSTATQSTDSHESQDSDCHCVCHLKFNHISIALINPRLAATGQIFAGPAFVTHCVSDRIDHPPTV